MVPEMHIPPTLAFTTCSLLLFAAACGSDSGGEATGGAGGSGGAGAGGAGGGGGPPPTLVEIPGLACGGVLDEDLQPPTAVIGGRDVYVDYGCEKWSGTPTTFILNLHGTMGDEGGKIYQRYYFPTFQYVDTHDFVVVTPKSVVAQWGNGDDGADEPHLLEVVEWMYETFSDFDVRGMWVVGHSWGSAYTLGFACKAELEERVSGVVLMSGGAGMPACADRLSVMATVGELDIVPGQPDQTTAAMAHGCGVATTYEVGDNVVTEWPDCDPGWVHRNYFMNGRAHGFNPVDWPEEVMNDHMADAIRATRLP
jgi:pimeloyl-ACP methyl ester carboxylesterase